MSKNGVQNPVFAHFVASIVKKKGVEERPHPSF
jgi:hypothetical protein